MRRRLWLALVLVLCCPAVGQAYIGPGAGFALVSSFFGILAATLLALLSLLRWPFRVLWRLVRGRPRRAARIRRLVIIGFDGQSPALTDAWMAAGRLPNFAALAARGCYHRLRSTIPPVSPVAWSSFATGVNPGRHGIFDFIDRDPRTYLPRISSTRIDPPVRALRLGPWRVPIGRTRLRLLRGSQPFWSLLGRAGVWSTILRVPVTFPPDRFHGAQLSAMAAPDLLGTQGTYFLLTTRDPPHPNPLPARIRQGFVGQASGERGTSAEGAGIRVPLVFDGDRAVARIEGPANPMRVDGRPLTATVTVRRGTDGRSVTLRVGRETVRLEFGVLSAWTPLTFPVAPFVRAHGLGRFQLTEIGDHVSIYLSPIGLDPERPAMPISHPAFYAPYLAKKIGPYSTLGLAEDTSALNDGVIDQPTFLTQLRDIDEERQRMCLAALDRLREGALACVFDATDRVQHMFWRELDSPQRSSAIEDVYRRNDAFLGDVASRLDKDDVLIVLSDHGFTAFRRGVNLNRWLLDRGYLALRSDADPAAEWLAAIDWTRTRAYAVGLTGIFLNVAGRERHGVVERGAAGALASEIAAALTGLRDDEHDTRAIRSVRRAVDIWDGPYLDRAPDLVVGCDEGYRVSWACASGAVAGPLFEDNVRAWSGDHCVDTDIVPGVVFCSRPIDRDDPALVDIAPTALTLFGVDVPAHMQGRPLFGVIGDGIQSRPRSISDE
jgi:predicted AlkP superfamily phosphohydrolase/phosphomutase